MCFCQHVAIYIQWLIIAGTWAKDEAILHICVLEMMAALLALIVLRPGMFDETLRCAGEQQCN